MIYPPKYATTLGFLIMSASPQLAAEQIYIEPPMVAIPKGQFQMGSDNGRGNEQPVHNVSINSFMLGQYEVTVKEFSLFVKATGHITSNPKDSKCMRLNKLSENGEGSSLKLDVGSWSTPAYAPSEFHPALCVSAEDAQAYAKWLSKETGKPYRLPTEAEWEYAARAGSTSNYFFGNDAAQLCHYGNVYDQRGRAALLRDVNQSGPYAPCDDKVEYTSVVGMYQPNAFGLYDTIGNVGELVEDCEHTSYQGAPTDGSAWKNNCSLFRGTEVMQVHRGGAYGLWSPPSRLHSSTRNHIGTDLRSSLGEGFRLALDTDKNSRMPASTSKFLKELKFAQSKEKKRRQQLTGFPDVPQQLTLNQNNADGYYQLTWQSNGAAKGTSYNIYRSQTFDGKMEKIATNVSAKQFVDQSMPLRKQSYQVTTVQNGKESLFSSPVVTDNVIKAIPGQIEAEDFNQMNKVTIGRVAKKEDGKGGLNLTGMGGIAKGTWTEYQIEVSKTGHYQFSYQIASQDGSKGFELILDQQKSESFAIPETGGWRSWQTVDGSAIHLTAGQHTLRILAIDSKWKLNWFAFNKIDS